MKKIFTLTMLLLCAVVGAKGENLTYALAEGDTFTSGQTVNVKNGDNTVATITYGESGGSDFNAASKDNSVSGYTACTSGNGTNGNKTGGTFYTIVPSYEGTIEVAVVLNADKAFYVLENGTALTDYNGIKKTEKYSGTFSFSVKANKSYKFYCAGSKLGFYGFKYTYSSLPSASLSFTTTSGSADMAEGTSFTLPTLTKTPSDITVTYSSSDETIATVNSETGAVTLIKAGTTTITASFAGNASYGAASATFTLTVTNSAAIEISVTYDISGVADIEGVAPESFNIIAGNTFTVPTNQTLYVEGKTLTGWNDGTNTYAIGASVTAPETNMTLTPVFVDNTVSFEDRTSAVTLKWDFQRKNGAPTFALEGASAIYVIQAIINGSTIDVKADLAATNGGKIANANWEDWCQMNKNTTITVPSVKKAVVSIEGFNVLGEQSKDGQIQFLTIDGSSEYTHAKTVSYTVNSETATIDVVIGEEGSYYRYVQVVLPKPELPAVSNKTWDFSTWTNTDYTTTTVVDNLEIAATESAKVSINSKLLKLGGTGNASQRHLRFKVAGPCLITAVAKHGSSSGDDRPLRISFGSFGTDMVVLENLVAGEDAKACSYNYTGGEQDIYIYSGNSGINLSSLSVISSVSKTISAAGYATYCSPYALNFSGVSGLTAYIAAKDGTKVKFTPVDNVPANTGVLLKGAEGDYSIPVIASSTTDVTDNILTGVLVNTSIEIGDYGYVLMNVSNVVGFYKTDTTKGFTVGANTAYIKSDKGLSRMFIGFDDDEVETTGINEVKNMKANNAIYNLKGMKVKTAQKGLYIINGKKVVK